MPRATSSRPSPARSTRPRRTSRRAGPRTTRCSKRRATTRSRRRRRSTGIPRRTGASSAVRCRSGTSSGKAFAPRRSRARRVWRASGRRGRRLDIPMTPKEDGPDELEGTEQPFVSHLIELRDRLIRALLAVGICFGILSLWPGPSGLYDLLAAPLVANLPKGTTLIATNVISPFLVPLKITLMAAFLLVLPVVLYQVWAFVAPGLYSHEKRLVMPLVVSSTILFIIGVAFCYFFVFGQVLGF